MTEFVLEAEALTRKFRGLLAVDALNLRVEQGSIYALIGPNGAGKTTLIQLLMNLLRPTAGCARVFGVDSRRLGGGDFARIGYVSENQEMPDGMTVGELLRYLRGFYPSWDRELEAQLLRRFELPLERKLRQLSRGMRMKAAFVSSFAYRPSLVVLDEPFSGLDPLVREQLTESILEIASEATVFFSSHDLAEIESFASHAGFLAHGRLAFSEELPVLLDRFRSVQATFREAPRLPAGLPAAWLQPQVSGHGVSFVHSNFDKDRARQEFAQWLPAAEQIEVEPMSLRSIYLAIAKSATEASSEPQQEDRA